MKKIFTIFLFSMLIVGYVGIKPVSAQTEVLPEGCSSTSGYSTITGQLCSNTITIPAGCTSTAGYSTVTGQLCSSGTTITTTSSTTQTFPTGCSSALGYSIITGNPCNGTGIATIGPLPGCTTALGYSITSGNPCSGTSTALNYLAGCSSTSGYSIFTGAPCNGTSIASSGGGTPTTPGLPTTGPDSNTAMNTILLLLSGLVVSIGLAYLIKTPSFVGKK